MITIKDFYQNNNTKTSYKYYEATKKNKYQQTIIEQKHSPPSNVMRASNRFMMSKDG